MESNKDVRLEVEGWEEPSSGPRRAGSRPVIPVRREENVDMSAPNSVSLKEDVENRACSYWETNVSLREGGLTRPNDVKRSRYSLSPHVEGRWRSATILASGIEPAPDGVRWRYRGSAGARETALASIRFGNSMKTRQYSRLGRSLEAGDDQPGCDIYPQAALALSGCIIVLSLVTLGA